MSFTARYKTICPSCNSYITPGSTVEGKPARHVSCSASAGAAPSKPASKSWNPDKFNGYGASRGGFTRSCKTGGNCSSFGSGKSCGAHDCDGY